jgi:hypothetical protein
MTKDGIRPETSLSPAFLHHNKDQPVEFGDNVRAKLSPRTSSAEKQQALSLIIYAQSWELIRQ